jgi:hypothetical protein
MIAFFGCWGYLGKGSGHEKVFSILENIKASEIVVLGDNYYSEKTKITDKDGNKKKIKKNNYDHLNHLFSRLNGLTPEKGIHLLMGNHELQIGGIKLIGNNNPEYPLFNTEYELSQEYNFNTAIGTHYIPEMKCYLVKVDTNLFDSKYNNSIYRYEPEQSKESLLPLLDGLEYKENHKVFICGHVPIVTWRKKKGDSRFLSELDISGINKMCELIQRIHGMEYKASDIFYMCADTHYFQTMKLDIDGVGEILQITNGGGGTDLDEIPIEADPITIFEGDKYGPVNSASEVFTLHKHGVLYYNTEPRNIFNFIFEIDAGSGNYLIELDQPIRSGKSKKLKHKSKKNRNKKKSKKRRTKRKSKKRKTKRRSKKHK